MTEIEIVAQTIAPEVFECPKINLNKPAYDRAYERAQAAITALDKLRIERAGGLEVRLRARARLTDLQANQDAFLEAAATIASQRAENFMLAAGACINPGDGGLIGDEHGNSVCTVYEDKLKLEAEVSELMANLNEVRAEIERAKLDGVRAGIEAMRGQAFRAVLAASLSKAVWDSADALSAEAIAKGDA